MREDDAMVLAWPKCGTHWMWEVTKMLRRGAAKHDPMVKESAMLEFTVRDYIRFFICFSVLNLLFLKAIYQSHTDTKQSFS